MQACVYLFSSILQIRSSVLAIPSQVACNEALHATGWLIKWMRMETSLLTQFFLLYVHVELNLTANVLKS